jgi:Tfp pilus assembly protein PilF
MGPGGAAAPDGDEARARPPRAKVRSLHQDRLRKSARSRVAKDLEDQRKKARAYYKAGLEQLEEGQPVKAASSLHLALQYDPKNEEYQKKFDEVNALATEAQAGTRVQEARAAKEFGNPKKAQTLYRKACEYELDDHKAYKELADLEASVAKDERAALKWMKVAVEHAPDNVEWRLELAELYIKQKMKTNARREFDEVLKRDPKNKTAKKGKWRVFF